MVNRFFKSKANNRGEKLVQVRGLSPHYKFLVTTETGERFRSTLTYNTVVEAAIAGGADLSQEVFPKSDFTVDQILKDMESV